VGSDYYRRSYVVPRLDSGFKIPKAYISCRMAITVLHSDDMHQHFTDVAGACADRFACFVQNYIERAVDAKRQNHGF
jgi:hypothetical protein